MKKLTLFLVALLAFSCLRAEITYELNGGKYNDYGWTSKADMFAACMADGDVTGLGSLDAVKASTDPFATICTPLTNANVTKLMSLQKWDWLEEYILTAQNAQKGNPVANSTVPGLTAGTASAAWRYAIAAFFLETQRTGWPYSADFSEAGKDAAYIPAWGQNYGNPTDPTEEVTLVEPYRAGYLFDGWYASADFSGEKVTKVDQNTTGTLYAKWVLDGIVYELNGGKYNDYGWTCKADICYDLQVDYNAAYSTTKAWAKKEGGVVYYYINGTWMTETEAKGQEAAVTGFLYPATYINTETTDPRLMPLVETTKADKYGWLKEYITANRATQSLTGDMSTLGETFYRAEISAFFLCSPARTAWPKSSSYEATGDYEDFQHYWGQAFPNPEHPTAEVVLNNPVKTGYKFLGWYDNEACTGTPITKVDQNTKGTLYAKWVLEGIVYELNGGVWNQYGWESKKDMYDAFLTDWKAYSGSTRGTKTYEEQLGVGKSSAGIPTTISYTNPSGVEYRSLIIPFFTESNYQTKWGWLATYLDAVAEQQGKTTKPTTNGATLTFSLGNFFGEDNAQTTGFINAVDFTGAEAHIAAFQTTWGQSFPNPKNPTEEVVLNIAYKSRYTFEGWYDNAECTGTAITTVDENYAGTLYAKWSIAPITYNLNGGQYNEYGWETKEDIYNDFLKDWKAYQGADASGRGVVSFETQLGVGNGHKGVPTTINSADFRNNLPGMFTNPTYSAKWGWLATYIDAVAAQQGKTQPTTNGATLTFSLGNFFGEDKNINYSAVDFTGDARYLVSAQLSCSFTLPNPTYPTSEVTINNPTKEGYIFDGWYANADLSGAKVTKVNADTKGTLYAKWTEQVIIIDDKAVNSTALAEYNGQIVTAKVTRAFNNDSYKTLTLPFDMNEEQIKAVFGETAIVHEFTSVGEANDMFYLHFEQTTPATIEAGKPYIIQLPETGDYDAKDGFTIEGVTINITPNPVVHGAITMQPILDGGGRLDQASQYWLASDNYLYSAGAHPTALLGLRAYFINSTGRPIRARVVYGENEATSIPTVVAPEDNVRKVLKDGQIIIIRGEKQYNIQGQVIE